jgi:Rieske Fe-S protein
LSWITYAAGAVATVLVAIPFIGYIFRIRKPPPKWLDLGEVSRYAVGETRLVTFDNPLGEPWNGMTGRNAVYVRNEGPADNPQFLVFAVNCAHLGCPVSWFQEAGLFMCPCHGGVYYANGDRASGPPPGPLFQCEKRVENGRLLVRAPHYPTEHNPLVKHRAKA